MISRECTSLSSSDRPLAGSDARPPAHVGMTLVGHKRCSSNMWVPGDTCLCNIVDDWLCMAATLVNTSTRLLKRRPQRTSAHNHRHKCKTPRPKTNAEITMTPEA